MEKNQTFSIQRILTIVKRKYSVCEVTSYHLGRVIRVNNITRKRTTIRYFPETRYGKNINLKLEMKTFYKNVDKFNIKDIICLDQTSIHACMKSSYSRCKLGKRCMIKTTNNKVFTKYTVLVVVSSNGVVLPRIIINIDKYICLK